MQSITSLLGSFSYPAPSKGSRRTWRSDFIDEFVAQINSERKGGFYFKDGKKIMLRNVTPKEIAFRVAHLRTGQDMHYLLSICKSDKIRGGSFSKTFFGSLKNRENKMC